MQPAPQAQPVSVVPMIADPTGGSAGEPKPGMRHLDGRLIAIIPKIFEPNAAGIQAGQITPRITADVYVLSGAAFDYGDNRNLGTPPSMRMSTVPCLVRDMWINQRFLVPMLADKIGSAVVGRVTREANTKGQPTFKLDVATDAEKQLFVQVWTTFSQNPGAVPVAVEIATGRPWAPPVATPVAPQYGQQLPGSLVAQQQAQHVAAMTALAPLQPVPVPVPQPVPVPVPQPVPMLDLSVPPAGSEWASPGYAEQWARLDEASKRAVYAAHAGQVTGY